MIRPLRILSIVLLCSTMTWVPEPASALVVAPKKKKKKSKEDDLKKQQIEYAKSLYGEGVKALEAKDYKTAVGKFEEAYRYAPELHAFNYNIGLAAHEGGDCAKAKAAFERFIQYVPDHPQRADAESKLEKISDSDCATGGPIPGTETTTTTPGEDDQTEVPGTKKKMDDQAKKEAELLFDALKEVRKARALYSKIAQKMGKQKPFAGIARSKKRHEKCLLKLIGEHGLTPPAPPDTTEIAVEANKKAACKKAVSYERRNVSALESGRDIVELQRDFRAFKKMHRQAQFRHLEKVEACS